MTDVFAVYEGYRSSIAVFLFIPLVLFTLHIIRHSFLTGN